MGKRFYVLIVTAIILFPTVSVIVSSDEISDPDNTNRLVQNISTPVIPPGKSDKLSFELENPYSIDMTDIRLKVEIYRYLDLGRDDSIEDTPYFSSSEDNSSIVDMNVLQSSEKRNVQLSIETYDETNLGVYSVRFKLEFNYDGEEKVMKSKGYFGEEEWEYATREETGSDKQYYQGNVNITYLDVDGILKETTFSVKKQKPYWTQYLLVGLSVFFAVVAIVFYLQEEYRSFPWLKKISDKWSRKFDEFRRGLKDRFRK